MVFQHSAVDKDAVVLHQEAVDDWAGVAGEQEPWTHVGADAQAPAVGIAVYHVVPAPDQGDPWPATVDAKLDVEAELDVLGWFV